MSTKNVECSEYSAGSGRFQNERFNFGYWHSKPLVRLALPAQPVDATPSNALIRQCFPGRSDPFGCTLSKPSQGSVPADLTLANDLAFVFNASRVRPACCVDPLRSPGIPDKVVPAPTCTVTAF